jgi:hypothetical protein
MALALAGKVVAERHPEEELGHADGAEARDEEMSAFVYDDKQREDDESPDERRECS